MCEINVSLKPTSIAFDGSRVACAEARPCLPSCPPRQRGDLKPWSLLLRSRPQATPMGLCWAPSRFDLLGHQLLILGTAHLLPPLVALELQLGWTCMGFSSPSGRPSARFVSVHQPTSASPPPLPTSARCRAAGLGVREEFMQRSLRADDPHSLLRGLGNPESQSPGQKSF